MTTAVVKEFQRVSSALERGSHDNERMDKATEICSFFLRHRAEAWVRTRRLQPVLYQYGNDTTPLTTKERYTAEYADLKTVRYGRNKRDLLAERLFIADTAGEVITVFTDPKEVATKDAWPCFSCFRALMPLPCELGHRHIGIFFHCYDGALQSCLLRKARQLHEAMSAKSRRDLPQGEHWLRWLQTWVMGVVCMSHSVHNALHWATAEFSHDKQCMRSCFICIESLRNGYSSLIMCIGRWLSDKITWEDWDHPDIDEVWRTLSVDVGLIADLSEMEVRFTAGRLRIATRFQNDPEVPAKLTAIFVKMWEFRKFSSGRWCSMGRSARRVQASVLLGLSNLVSFILDNTSESKWYLRGWRNHYQGLVPRCIATLALCSFGADSVLMMIEEDDRLSLQITDIERELKEEIEAVQNISDATWQIFADTAGVSSAVFRTSCTQAVLVVGG